MIKIALEIKDNGDAIDYSLSIEATQHNARECMILASKGKREVIQQIDELLDDVLSQIEGIDTQRK